MKTVGQYFGVNDDDIRMAPCLLDGPLSSASRELVCAARSLGNTNFANLLRVACVPYLFDGMELDFAAQSSPVDLLCSRITRLTECLRNMVDAGMSRIGTSLSGPDQDPVQSSTLRITGEHYGRLFRQFSDTSYFTEPAELLRQRLVRNGFDLDRFRGARVLDAGCGGGRYTVAWRLLGAGAAVGVDISEPGIADARRRVQAASVDNVSFEQSDVLQLPFPDDSFDVVFSNGVLHHTTDWRAGVVELLRVLRPGGIGWLYLIENPGGLFWDTIEILRVIMKDDSRDHARISLEFLGIPANRVFYMLDHVMVPINTRCMPMEVIDALTDAGASDIRRLERGVDFDRIERIYQQEPFADVKYGVGENRFTFSKNTSLPTQFD